MSGIDERRRVSFGSIAERYDPMTAVLCLARAD